MPFQTFHMQAYKSQAAGKNCDKTSNIKLY